MGDSDLAVPFQSLAVTSSFAVSNGLVDLKVAAAFYDRIIIIDHDVFEPKLLDTLGPDYQYLSERGLIDVRKVGNTAGVARDQPGYTYAEKIASGIASTVFSTAARAPKTIEVLGNGMARLQAALMHCSETEQQFTPIVTSRKIAPSFGRKFRFDLEDPLPSDDQLEKLLPVRATATRILFEKLPVPGREMPWEEILQLREDADTGLYAARMRILLRRLAKEDDRRHVEDLIQTEFAEFESKLRGFKGQRRTARIQMVMPWADLVHGLVKALALAKPSEVLAPIFRTREEIVKLNKAEEEIKKDPYYLIEHVRSRLA